MPANRITIPEDLLRLKPSDALESVSMSCLARKGTSVLQRIMTTAQAVAVKIQGKGAMVTLSKRQYDEMVDLIHRLQEQDAEDGFTRELGRRFDELVAGMNRPGAAETMDAALFDDTAALNRTYRHGATESDD